MKVVILYHPNSEFARTVEEYARDFEHQRAKKIELISLDTQEGSSLATLYDITRFPAMIASRDSGEMMNLWQDEQLPLMNEVAAYFD